MKILLAIDNQEIADDITAFMESSAPGAGAEVKVVMVIPSIMAYAPLAIVPSLMQEQRDQTRNQALALVNNTARGIVNAFTEAHVEALVIEGTPAHEILSAADDWGADLIYVGSHGKKGLRRMALGSVSQEVVSKANCSVFVVKDHTSTKKTSLERASRSNFTPSMAAHD